MLFSNVSFNQKRTVVWFTLTPGVADCATAQCGSRLKGETEASGRCAPGRVHVLRSLEIDFYGNRVLRSLSKTAQLRVCRRPECDQGGSRASCLAVLPHEADYAEVDARV